MSIQLFCCLAAFALTASIAGAQSFTGAILGVVTDPSGAVVPAAQVTAINQGTGDSRTAQATEVGQYTISGLPPGAYTLQAEAPGFKMYKRPGLVVDVLQNVRVDIGLETGAVTEVVSVTAESPLLETANASLGVVVDEKRLRDLPLNGRNVMALLGGTPGVSTGGGYGGQPVLQNVYAQGNFAVNSGIQTQSESLLDGIPNNVFLWNAPAFVPSVDAVQEFKVQTSGFSAEFGHTGGGIINITTKSGTNEFHGTLFEFLRNDNLDANAFFNNRSGAPRAPFTYNQFGGSLGAPVLRNRTFIFGAFDGFRESRGRSLLVTVPQVEQRQGDFSLTRAANNQPILIYDPQTVRATPGVGSGFTRDPFPGNRIPSTRFDPAGSKATALWALPNLPGDGPARINNFFGAPTVGSTQDQVNVRADHIFSAKHRTFGRYSYNRMIPGQSDLFGTVPGAVSLNPFELATALKIWSRNVGLDHTWLISPSLLASFRYGFTRQRQFRDPASLGADMVALGFSRQFQDSVQLRMVPTFAPAGFQGVGEGGGNIFFRRGDNVHSWTSALTKTLSRQTVKFGFEFRGFFFHDTRAPTGGGNFAFTPAFTQADPLRAAATAGHSVASLLLGLPANGAANFFPAVSMNQSYYGLFVQDDIRLTRNLTINLGLRYDLETPKNERYNRLSTFDQSVQSPLAARAGLDVRGGLRFLGVDGLSRRQWAQDKNNIAPRFGFAYRVTPHFVARGGYGIFFHQTVGQGGLVGNGNDGFAASNTMVTTRDGGITPANRLSDPFPEGLAQPTGSRLGLLSRLGESLQQWDARFNTAYTQQFNFGLQYEIPRLFLVEAAYVGSHSVGLPQIIALNQLNSSFLPLGNQLLTQVTNPFFGLVDTGAMAAAQVARGRLLRPFPQFENINFFTPIAQASFQSFQLRIERRFQNDFAFRVAYTIGKSLTDAGGTGIFAFNSLSTQDPYARRLEKSLSPIDTSQRFVASYQWELPFGKGKRLLGGASGVLDKIVSGWQVNGITSFQTGSPLALTTAVNQTNALGGTSRPNIAAGVSAELESDQRSIDRWFNTGVFSQPPAFTFGNVSRTLPDTRGPGLQNFDFSLFKNTRIRERINLQLRWELFNAFNHTNFSQPGQAFGNPQFGVISASDLPRIMQVAAKIIF